MQRRKKRNIKKIFLFALLRFLVLVGGYAVIFIFYTDFQSLCLSIFIFVLGIAADTLILFLAEGQTKFQSWISGSGLVLSIIFLFFSFLGIAGRLEFNREAHSVIIHNSLNLTFLNLSFQLDFVGVLLFILICIYVVDFTNNIRRPGLESSLETS